MHHPTISICVTQQQCIKKNREVMLAKIHVIIATAKVYIKITMTSLVNLICNIFSNGGYKELEIVFSLLEIGMRDSVYPKLI